jgi:hypothetical protein
MASTVLTRLVKMMAPSLNENGFTRIGRLFVRPEGDLNGVVELRFQPSLGDNVVRFRVEWGITLPGLVARYAVSKRPEDLGVEYAARGQAVVPP